MDFERELQALEALSPCESTCPVVADTLEILRLLDIIKALKAELKEAKNENRTQETNRQA